MQLQLTKDTFAFKVVENPFKKVVTESGIFLVSGVADSDETGAMEQLEQRIMFGIVTITGPDCKVVAVGDGIYFDKHSIQPVPYNEPVWLLHEGSIRAYVKNDGTLEDLVAAKEEELKAFQFRSSLAMEQPLGATAQIAGTAGSGLKLVQ
jgi:hypothetical protein